MLKISIIETPTKKMMVLEGRLTEPYIPELLSAWDNARRAYPAESFIIDLREATFIDQSCERVLLNMKQEGAQFIACGISTTHQLEHLGIPCRGLVHKDN